MAAVDRNILRLAAAELMEGVTAPKIVLDEAVRLAQWFAGPPEISFWTLRAEEA